MRYIEITLRGLTQVLFLSASAQALTARQQPPPHYSGLISDVRLTSFIDDWRMDTHDQGAVLVGFDGVLVNDSNYFDFTPTDDSSWTEQARKIIRPINGSLEWLSHYFFSLVNAQDEHHCFFTDRGIFASVNGASGLEYANEASLCFEWREQRDLNSLMVRRSRLVADMQVDVVRLWLTHFFRYVPVEQTVLAKIAYQVGALCHEADPRCYVISESAPWFVAETFRAITEADFNLATFAAIARPCQSTQFLYDDCHVLGNQVWIRDGHFTAAYDRRPVNFSRDAVVSGEAKWALLSTVHDGELAKRIASHSGLFFISNEDLQFVEDGLATHNFSRVVLVNGNQQAYELARRYPERILLVSAASISSLSSEVMPLNQSAPAAHQICDPFLEPSAMENDLTLLVLGAASVASAAVCYVLCCVKRYERKDKNDLAFVSRNRSTLYLATAESGDESKGLLSVSHDDNAVDWRNPMTK